MTDLTEQYQKGELPAGWYWCECYKEEIKILYYDRDCFELDDPETKNYYFFLKKDCEEITILAPVPTYSEYLALQSDSLAKNEATEIIAELEAKVKKLKKDYKDLEYKYRSYKDFKETAYDLDTSRLEEEMYRKFAVAFTKMYRKMSNKIVDVLIHTTEELKQDD